MPAEVCLGHVYQMVFAWALVKKYQKGVDNFASISRGMVVVVFVVVFVVAVIGMFIQSIKRHPHSARSAALLTRVGENMRVVDPSIRFQFFFAGPCCFPSLFSARGFVVSLCALCNMQRGWKA